MKFGLHKGKQLKDVPAAYWRYMYDTSKLKGSLKKYVEETVPDIRLQVEKTKKLK